MVRLLGVAFLFGATLAAGPSPAAATATPTCFGEPATILGQSGVIVGAYGNDVIIGSPGPDVIYGFGGDDLICAGDGDDDVYGGVGIDFIVSEGGSDTLFGDAGNDLLAETRDLDFSCADPTPTGDVLWGGSGDDVLLDPCGFNEVDGGQGSDIIFVSGLADAGSGNDNDGSSDLPTSQPISVTIRIFPPVFAIETCPGCKDGRAKGGSGRDAVGVRGGIADGGSGNDQVYGLLASDELRGGSGNDELHNFSGATPMTLIGGSGFDDCSNNFAGDQLISCEVV